MSGIYPIWVDINSCAYQSDKSYGIKEKGLQQIYVGSNSKNKRLLASVRIEKSFLLEHVYFDYYLDNVLLKRVIFTEVDGKAKEYVETQSFITNA